MTDRADWAHQRERSNLLALRMMRWIATTLGRRVSRLVLHPITLYFLCSGGPATQASSAYLARVLGRAPRWTERYRHVHHFAATVLDRVYLLRGQFDQFEIQATGVDHLDGVLLEGRGVLLVGAHLGSFEALRSLGQARRGLRVAMVMYEDNARQINAALQAIAPDADLHVIGLGRLEAMMALSEWLDGGGVAGLLADRTLNAPPGAGAAQRARTQRFDFLGQSATFSDGPFRLAALLRRPVVFMTGLYHGGRRYELRFTPLADFTQRPPRGPGAREALDASIHDAMSRYVRLLEDLCRETPYNWFNFFDFWAAGAASDGGDAVRAGAGPAAAPVAEPGGGVRP
ncbi:acyl-CoA synthetase [uncultured Sphaerotilus sp.]|uniref:LpxL/LpxP family acyltransferase n=1 Tax=uncultured Sphaerotilus sp. TaxID=474984 RepID=UPI0030CA5270